jgi:hypothetical protein
VGAFLLFSSLRRPAAPARRARPANLKLFLGFWFPEYFAGQFDKIYLLTS